MISFKNAHNRPFSKQVHSHYTHTVLQYSLCVRKKKTFNIHAPVFHVLILVHVCLQLGEPGKKLQHALKQIILHMHIV